MGEGWHNNHHHHAHLARQGLRWWEIDVTWYILFLLEKVHVIWGVRRPKVEDRPDRRGSDHHDDDRETAAA